MQSWDSASPSSRKKDSHPLKKVFKNSELIGVDENNSDDEMAAPKVVFLNGPSSKFSTIIRNKKSKSSSVVPSSQSINPITSLPTHRKPVAGGELTFLEE
jgi:hypothetical protein